MLNDFVDDKVKGLIEKKEWMEKCTFTMVKTRDQFTGIVDGLIAKGLCALDLETTSLNTRVDKLGNSMAKLVGICLADTIFNGWYTPVGHEDREYNLPYDFIVRELARLVKNCRCVFHHFKYDGQVLHNHGIDITDESMIEDTFLMAGVADASLKPQGRGLKILSETLLNRPMIDINSLIVHSGKKKIVKFDLVPPQIALYYGASDAMNTLGLYEWFKKELDKQDPDKKQGPWAVYERIEKRCLFPVMQMERNLCKIDTPYLRQLKVKLDEKRAKALKAVHDLVGRELDVNSPKQLGTYLFEEMKINYPEKEKTASGQYSTEESTLQKIADVPIVGLILDYRSLEKVITTYIDNFLANADEEDCVKFQLNQLQADTGRFSASGGMGLKQDGYCKVNCQNIPKPDDEDEEVPDIRRAIIARPGYKLVSVDYSGEELRIAANMSREPKWIEEFMHGTKDLHTMTAKIIHNKSAVTKKERNLGKTINFLTLYGGGAGGFAAQAKIPYEQAKKMIINFFRGYVVLKR
jgi:DNA polymerase-1